MTTRDLPALIATPDDPNRWSKAALTQAFDELKRQWSDVGAKTAQMRGEVLAKIARLWPALRANNLTPTDSRLFSATVTHWLSVVAAGTLLPGLLVAFSHSSRAISRLFELSLADQQRVLDNEDVEVWDPIKPVRKVPILLLTTKAFVKVVYGGRILTAAEQATRFEQAVHHTRKKKPADEPQERKPRVRVVPSTGELRVGGVRVSVVETLEAISKTQKTMAPPPIVQDNDTAAQSGYETLGVMLPTKLLRALEATAEKTNVPVRQLAFNAIAAYAGWTLDADE